MPPHLLHGQQGRIGLVFCRNKRFGDLEEAFAAICDRAPGRPLSCEDSKRKLFQNPQTGFCSAKQNRVLGV